MGFFTYAQFMIFTPPMLLYREGFPLFENYCTIKNTKLHSIITSNKLYVNSAHHQSIKNAGKNLTINAISKDGVIEGIEDPKKLFCIGVQWHPEFFINSGDKKLIKNFIKSC